MAISFDSALGIHEKSLLIREKRAELISNNLANADTPNYKAKDIDFNKALEFAMSGQRTGLKTTHDNHYSGGEGVELHLSTQYRVPNQSDTGDGNTVDANIEKMNFAENAMQYQTSLTLISKKFKGLMSAIKGE